MTLTFAGPADVIVNFDTEIIVRKCRYSDFFVSLWKSKRYNARTAIEYGKQGHVFMQDKNNTKKDGIHSFIYTKKL